MAKEIKTRRKVVESKKVNVKKHIKFKVATLAVILSMTTICVGNGLYERYENNRVKHENAYGYENITPFDYYKVKSDDFVVLNAGDHNTIGTLFLDKKIQACNKDDISVGLVVMSEAKNEEDIYNDVEHIKGILTKNSVNYPVYLNVDKIIENDSLNVEMKTKIIKNFLEKCQSNNIYVGIHGKDSNLCRVKKYCKIVDYDAFVIPDNNSNEIKYDGNYTLYKDGKKIVSKTNLATVIEERDFNDSNRFIKDGKHIVQKDESILDISCNYGLSVNEILSFNDLKKEDIHEGMTLRIPSVLDRSIPGINDEKVKLDVPLRGCDISYCQSTNMDWNKLSENFDYVIIRVSQGKNLDVCFENNIYNCNMYNIPVGVYCFNDVRRNGRSDELFRKELEEQADFVISKLNNKNLVYPVYLDIETLYKGETIFDAYPKEDIKIMLDVWAEKMLNVGYEPGLYVNREGFWHITNSVDYDISEKFHTWVAGGEQFNQEKDLTDVKIPNDSYEYKNQTYSPDMQQVTQFAKNSGAGNGQGHLDINYSYVDYENIERLQNNADALFDIKEFNQFPTLEQTALIGGVSAGSLFLLGGAGYLIARRKIKTL